MLSVQTGNPLARTKFVLLILLAISTVVLHSQPAGSPIFALGARFALIVLFAAIHGTQRYGAKTMAIWFLLAWVVSNALEALSIRTGFPFGFYHYTAGGPRLLDVPLGIMPIYFGISYISWTVAQAVIGHFDRPITGWFKLIIPVTTAMVMTMWDVITDPQASTLQGIWKWHDGGAYFGVPISNFAGWVLVVYIFMQLFTLLIARDARAGQVTPIASHGRYWVEAIAAYVIMGSGIVLEGFVRKTNVEIHASMAMIAMFTMLFTGFVALLNVQRDRR